MAGTESGKKTGDIYSDNTETNLLSLSNMNKKLTKDAEDELRLILANPNESNRIRMRKLYRFLTGASEQEAHSKSAEDIKKHMEQLGKNRYTAASYVSIILALVFAATCVLLGIYVLPTLFIGGVFTVSSAILTGAVGALVGATLGNIGLILALKNNDYTHIAFKNAEMRSTTVMALMVGAGLPIYLAFTVAPGLIPIFASLVPILTFGLATSTSLVAPLVLIGLSGIFAAALLFTALVALANITFNKGLQKSYDNALEVGKSTKSLDIEAVDTPKNHLVEFKLTEAEELIKVALVDCALREPLTVDSLTGITVADDLEQPSTQMQVSISSLEDISLTVLQATHAELIQLRLSGMTEVDLHDDNKADTIPSPYPEGHPIDRSISTLDTWIKNKAAQVSHLNFLASKKSTLTSVDHASTSTLSGQSSLDANTASADGKRDAVEPISMAAVASMSATMAGSDSKEPLTSFAIESPKTNKKSHLDSQTTLTDKDIIAKNFLVQMALTKKFRADLLNGVNIQVLQAVYINLVGRSGAAADDTYQNYIEILSQAITRKGGEIPSQSAFTSRQLDSTTDRKLDTVAVDPASTFAPLTSASLSALGRQLPTKTATAYAAPSPVAAAPASIDNPSASQADTSITTVASTSDRRGSLGVQ